MADNSFFQITAIVSTDIGVQMEVSDEGVMSDRWSSRRRREGGRWRRSDGGSVTTPILDWKFFNREYPAHGGVCSAAPAAVSARKLAAARWELGAITNCGGGLRGQFGPYDELGRKLCSPSPIPKCAMERATKWNNSYSKASAYVNHFHTHPKLLNNQEASTLSLTSCDEFSKPKKCTKELKHFIHNLNEEETSSRMTTDHQMCMIIKKLKGDLRRERKTCKKMYIVNSKLQKDIVETNSLATRIMHNYEKEKKARNLLEDICNKQAKIIEASKAKRSELRDQCARILEDVEEEREMLQIADSWREERAQMKLDDAKFILEDKYCELDNLIEGVKTFLRSSNFATGVNGMSNIKAVEEVLYMLSKYDTEFAVVKDSQIGRDEDEAYHA